jgi:uncharacterized protein YbaP (TraB family)
MIRKSLLALAALLATACAPPADAKPPVWVVKDADSEIVLFGSVHVLPPGLDWRPAQLDSALAAADDLWFELPVDQASETGVAGLAAARGVLPEGRSLSALLSPVGQARLKAAADRYGLSFALLDRFEPWFAEVALAAVQFRNAGADAASGVEKALSASAPAGVKRQAFESPAQQIALFDGAPVSEQVASLEETLDELETDPDAYDDLVRAWMTGDLAALDEDALAPLRKAAPGLYRRLVSDRNAAWVKTLQQRLAGSGKTVVVVGVGHLVGQDGVPARLRALGYSVEGP